ncbi:hypothetical protein RLOC_00010215 [Lonchura striata]|uniref:Uncharacterized protein n=1 Tax=Lonchura striata TaxID=40157 RepID=A0A218U8M8_9PASE|nr:hypothetical protein RLOC_00010215 [Lonchura striata domestica]
MAAGMGKGAEPMREGAGLGMANHCSPDLHIQIFSFHVWPQKDPGTRGRGMTQGSRTTRTTTPSSCRGWARTSPSSRWPITSNRSGLSRPTRRPASP